MAEKRFIRLKVISYTLNEIWSINLANMQQLRQFRNKVPFRTCRHLLSISLGIRNEIKKLPGMCRRPEKTLLFLIVEEQVQNLHKNFLFQKL